MNKKMKCKIRMFTLVAVTGSFIGLTGCATTGNVEDLQAQIDAIAADAASAKSDAAAANATANEALNAANSAINIANEANARSMETETKIDRMFKKAMHK